MKKHIAPILGVSSLVVLGCILSVYFGVYDKLKSDVLESEPLCYIQSDMDLLTAKKAGIESEIVTINAQLKTIAQKTEENNANHTKISTKIDELQTKILSDEALAYEKKKVDDILIQRDKKSALEVLKTEVDTKKKLADTDKQDYERLYLLVTPKQSIYNAALTQYNDKVTLDGLKTARDNLPNPPTAQVTARKNLETLGTPIINTKKPPAAQITDRQDLEKKDAAQKTAYKKVPAKTNRTYATLQKAYTDAYGIYDTALKNYNTKYEKSDFVVTMTYAQLNTAVTKYTKYETALKNYNTKYANNPTTLSQFNKQVEEYAKANSLYSGKLSQYNATYKTANRRTTDNRTAAELLIVKDNAKNALDTVNAPYLSMKKAYDTVSNPAYQGSLATYIKQNEDYLAVYKDSPLSAAELTKNHEKALGLYTTLSENNETNKKTLSEYQIEKDTYEMTKILLEKEKADVDETLGEKTKQLEAINTEMQKKTDNFCTKKFTCRSEMKNDDGKDGYIVYLEDAEKNRLNSSVTSLGQNDVNTQKFSIRYGETQAIFVTSLYLRGVEFMCPEITIQTDQFAGVESCEEELAAGDSDITCNGNDTITIEKRVPVEKIGILSSFLQSSALGENDCSAEEEAVKKINDEISEYQEQRDRYNRDIRRLEEETDEAFEEVQKIANEYNSYEDKSSTEAQAALQNYNSEYANYKSLEASNNDETLRTAGLRNTYDIFLEDLREDLREAEKKLQECQNKQDDDGESCTNGATNYPSCNDNQTCTNGATNYPGCDDNQTCTNGATNYPGCDDNQTCTNGASNYPDCNDNQSCTNGATNYPDCNNNTCTNGATNYPDCNDNPTCGNGTVESGEECDGGEHCSASCQNTPYCGNGTVDEGEECDGGTSCNSSCQEVCPEENLGSNIFGNFAFLKSDTLSEKCPKKCDNGLDKNEYPDCTCKNGGEIPDNGTCKCPKGQEVRDGMCQKKPNIIIRALRAGFYPLVHKEQGGGTFYGFGFNKSW